MFGTVRVRRYRCQACRAVTVVVPRGVLPRRLYAASAIALALALWGLGGVPPPAVRNRTSPCAATGANAAIAWASPCRWAREAARGALFPKVRSLALASTYREFAGRVATVLAGFAGAGDRGESLEVLAFLGGAQAA